MAIYDREGVLVYALKPIVALVTGYDTRAGSSANFAIVFLWKDISRTFFQGKTIGKIK